jgi:hypothetical protein
VHIDVDQPDGPLNRERPSADAPRSFSRRAFLGLLAATGVAVAGGCSPIPGKTSSTTAPTEPPPESTSLGPEPASYVPPAPKTQPPVGTQVDEIHADVCVVGGGAAGMAAATEAARAGARTVLLEESYMLGGNVTRGLVNLDKVSWGGPAMVKGYFDELVRELVSDGRAVYPSEQTHYAVPCHPDGLRHLALVIARRAGVDVRFGCQAVWADKIDRQLQAVWGQEGGHYIRVLAPVFIDCTGDGNLGYMAGSGYWLGDRTYGQIQGQTLIFYVGPMDYKKVVDFAERQGDLTNDYQIIGMTKLMQKLRDQKEITGRPQRGLLINRNVYPALVSISGSEIFANHLVPGAMQKILTMLTRQNFEIAAGLRAHVPGFERSTVVRMADRPYLREGRRLIGYYQLTADDCLMGKKPSDSIARGWYPLDLHVAYAGGAIQAGTLRGGDWYGIPYRSIVARDLDNLLMAGRCISVTHEALGSTRVSPLSMVLGQAAGIAAAQAARAKKRPIDLPVAALQRAIISREGLI